jgi:hypothetical protein
MNTQSRTVVYKSDFAEGAESFTRVKRTILKYMGVNIQTSSVNQDIYEGVDGFFVGVPIQSKGPKRIFGKTTKRQDQYLILEDTGVTGHPGSLWGDAKIFIFELNHDILLLDAAGLRAFFKSFITDRMKESSGRWRKELTHANKQLYRRKGNQDLITVVSVEDTVKFFKENNYSCTYLMKDESDWLDGELIEGTCTLTKTNIILSPKGEYIGDPNRQEI